jgi:hypothetical protein
MTIKTFWTILLKFFGLWFLFISLGVMFQILSMFLLVAKNSPSPDVKKSLLAIGMVLVVSLTIILILWLLIFKTNWVIEKLKLTKGFTEDRLELTMEWSTILTIATIVIGGVVFIDSFPLLVKQSLSFVQQGKPFRNNLESVWIVLYLVKTVLGYLLMTNSRFVVSFIGRQNRYNKIIEQDNLPNEE